MVPLGLGRHNGILGGLRESELHGRLSLDFDRLAGRWIAAHSGCTLGLHQLAQARNRELAVLSGVGGRGLDQEIEEGRDLLGRHFHLLGHVSNQLGLGHLLDRCLRTRRSLGWCCLLCRNSRLRRCCFLRRQWISPVFHFMLPIVSFDDRALSISALLNRSGLVCAQLPRSRIVGSNEPIASARELEPEALTVLDLRLFRRDRDG